MEWPTNAPRGAPSTQSIWPASLHSQRNRRGASEGSPAGSEPFVRRNSRSRSTRATTSLIDGIATPGLGGSLSTWATVSDGWGCSARIAAMKARESARATDETCLHSLAVSRAAARIGAATLISSAAKHATSSAESGSAATDKAVAIRTRSSIELRSSAIASSARRTSSCSASAGARATSSTSCRHRIARSCAAVAGCWSTVVSRSSNRTTSLAPVPNEGFPAAAVSGDNYSGRYRRLTIPKRDSGLHRFDRQKRGRPGGRPLGFDTCVCG